MAEKHKDLFDHLRLFAAAIVLWTHQFGLTGEKIPFCEPLKVNYGVVGVYMFFAISGYLNAISLDRWGSGVSFLAARAVRIYPALITCVVLSVLFGAAITTVRLSEYIENRDTVRYLAYNSTMLRGIMGFDLPGVFTSNPIPRVVNGSLWTLPMEAMTYVLFAVSMSAVQFRKEMPVLLLTIGVVGLVIADKTANFTDTPNAYFAKFAVAFLAAASIASLRNSKGLLGALIHVIALALVLLLLQSVSVACLLLLVAATVAIGSVRIPARYSLPLDISYGFYLYAWPLQQLGVQLFGDFWRSLAFSFCGTALMGMLSCILVERPIIAFYRGTPSRLLKKASP